MSWFKVDDGFADHPKVVALRSRKGWHRALALWTLAGAWSSRQLTDGFIPEGMVPILGCTRGDAASLVDVGLWERTEGGYRFHDFHDINPTRQHTLEKREKTRRKVQAWREEKRDCNQVTGEVRNQVTGDGVTTPVTPPPARPGPARSDLDRRGGASEPPTVLARGPLAEREALLARLLAALSAGWDRRYVGLVGAPSPRTHRADLKPLASWCAEYLETHPEEPDALVERMLEGFFARPDLKRPKPEWLTEDPARYLGLAATTAAAQRNAEFDHVMRELERARQEGRTDAVLDLERRLDELTPDPAGWLDEPTRPRPRSSREGPVSLGPLLAKVVGGGS